MRREPVESDVPTLLLSGEFDPITPPRNAELVAQGLPNSILYTAPFTGHGAALSDPCAAELVAAFLEGPLSPSFPTCIEEEGRPARFVTDDEIVATDFSRWLNYFFFALSEEEFALGPFLSGPLVFLGALMTLLTVIILWPLGWLAARSGPQESESEPISPVRGRRLRLIAGVLAMLNAFFAALFAIGLIWAIGLGIDEAPDLLTFGLPAASRPIFLLPPLILLLTLSMLIVAALAWGRGVWSRARRIYYLVLLAAAIALSVIFINLDFVTALL